MKVFLTGFMGAGKSATGLELAKRMGVDFVDLDALVAERTGEAVGVTLESRGEEAFRRFEHSELVDIAASDSPLVIATGGGAPTQAANVEAMRSAGTTVWLDPPFDSILERLNEASRRARPLFGSPSEARELYEKRRSSYESADLHLELDGVESPGEVAERILQALPDRGIRE